MVLWAVSTTHTLTADQSQDQQHVPLHQEQRPDITSAKKPPVQEKGRSSPYIPAPGDNPDTARERHERVRGKGTRTSLKKIQFEFPEESERDRLEREKRLKAVRDGFAHAWFGYKKHAWGHDEVRPVTGGFVDRFNGWGATMVDSLDTLVIMGFNKEFDEALDWVKNSFDMTKNPTERVQFFETIIRYLGGFLSAYDLTGEKVLLDKAEELGGYMLNAFQNRIFPAGRVAVQESANNFTSSGFVLAEIGTIQLEFSRLSMLTGNPVYDQKGRRIFDLLSTATSELPGLLPVYAQEKERYHYSSFKATLGGMADSYYEYLLKEWIILDGKAPLYRKMFEEAADSAAKYMVMMPDNGSKDYAILGTVYSTSKIPYPDMAHLACFMSGSFAMGAKYFDRPKDMVVAKQIAEGCYLGYHHSTTGLGPEDMKFDVGRDAKTFVVDRDNFYSRISSRTEYILRPETLESLWILYRLTGEKKYQDKAWEIFQSLERSCRTKIAYSGLSDVNRPGSHDDRMESFFMAETMKYLYLIFSTPDVISLDDFVLNTEAHPLRRT
ncbi:glycoside hydrolase [Mortierella sp. GBAus27b]|nr:glycoside hydrolase [Mortierella sp. GBAus27b]